MMEETSKIGMKVDGDEATDNCIVDQQVQSNEQTEKINLLEMPIEILEKILIHLDDAEHLLTASHVCKLFASVAEIAFAQIYSKKVYYIYGKSIHKVILNKYGSNIRNIEIYFEDDEIRDLIEQKCCNLENVAVFDVSRIPILKDLKEVVLAGIRNLDRDAFAEFVHNNRQLKILRLQNIEVDLVNVLDGRLNMLKTLGYAQYINFTTDLRKIRLNSLETLILRLPDTEGVLRLLQAMNCNQIKVLQCSNCFDRLGDDLIGEIRAFPMLVSLRLPNFQITEDQMRNLAHHLPRLTEFSTKMTEIESNAVQNRILSVLSMFPKLIKLKIKLKWSNKFLSDLEKSINGFHARFAGFGTDIKISTEGNTVSTSHNHLLICEYHCGEGPWGTYIELHWMENLNERNVRQVIKENLKGRDVIYEFKFINHCLESTLDISAFMHPNLEDTEILDITSDAPISIKANASRYHLFFPKLRIIVLDLDQRSTIDFLGELDSHFCKKINELWLNRKNVLKDGEMDQGHIKNILAKFENLTSVHLATSSTNFEEISIASVFSTPKL